MWGSVWRCANRSGILPSVGGHFGRMSGSRLFVGRMRPAGNALRPGEGGARDRPGCPLLVPMTGRARGKGLAWRRATPIFVASRLLTPVTARFTFPLAVLLGLAACTATQPALSPAAATEAALAADRAFAADFATRPLDGPALDRWVTYFAPDGARLALGGRTVQGHDAVRTWDAGLFRDPGTRLLWRPTSGGASADGRTAFTTGLSWLIRPTAIGADTLYRGTYLTVWQRGADGRWRLLLDTGADR